MAYFKYQGKSIYYEEYGQGEPLIFLHGNTASSKMSELLMPLYAEKFRCILIDFLGNGQSDRVESFSPDMWYDEALQTIAHETKKQNKQNKTKTASLKGSLLLILICFQNIN